LYRAASWPKLGQCEDGRGFTCTAGQWHARRSFHKGKWFPKDSEIVRDGYECRCDPKSSVICRFTNKKVKGKHRFAHGLTKKGRKRIALKLEELDRKQRLTKSADNLVTVVDRLSPRS
jgi:hypothetical protein